MAEKKKKDPKFGGKRSLKDTSGNKSIGFEDTYLGDLLGFDGKMGTKGKPGLLASLKGARRKKPGTTTTATKKKTTTKKKTEKEYSGRGTGAGGRRIRKAPEDTVGRGGAGAGGRRIRKAPEDTVGRGGAGAGGRRIRKAPEDRVGGGRGRDPGFGTAPAQKRKMKTVTLQAWKDMSPAQRVAAGLPKTQAEALRLSGAGTIGSSMYANMWKANRGGLAKKKPVAKMNKGGMAKKSGYMYGGSVTKKKPMNKGGMARKK